MNRKENYLIAREDEWGDHTAFVYSNGLGIRDTADTMKKFFRTQTNIAFFDAYACQQRIAEMHGADDLARLAARWECAGILILHQNERWEVRSTGITRTGDPRMLRDRRERHDRLMCNYRNAKMALGIA